MSGAAGKRHHITSTSNLMSSLEELLNKKNLIDIEEVNKAPGLEKKMEMIVQAILNVNNKFSTVHDMFNEANDGIDPHTSDCEDKLATLAEENKQLRFELDLVKGMHSKLEFENASLKAKVTALTAQQMKNNLTFAGLINDEDNETPMDVVSDFLTEKMHLDFRKSQIISARRIGFPSINKPRLMVAELHPDLKQLILSNVKALKGIHNENGKSYSIFKQLPDQWAEERRQVQEAVKRARSENDKKPETQEKSQIISARRIGFPSINKPRLMVAELHPDLKQLILSNVKALKGIHNENGKSYSIFKQLPDQWAEERRQVQEAVKRARSENDKKPETQEKSQIISTRRIGFPSINKPRLMVAELHPDLKQLILSNVKALKGVHNENGKSYSIFKQLPDQWAEERRQVQEAVKRARSENDKNLRHRRKM